MRLPSLRSVHDLPAFNAAQDRRGGGAFFGIGITQDQKDSSQQIAATGQGGLTLPDRDYYLNTSDALQDDSQAVSGAHAEDVRAAGRYAGAGRN